MITLGVKDMFSPANMVIIRKLKLSVKLIPFTLTRSAVTTSLAKEEKLHSHHLILYSSICYLFSWGSFDNFILISGTEIPPMFLQQLLFILPTR